MPSNKKNSGDAGTGTVTRVINPNTDTLQMDLEAAKSVDGLLIVVRGTPQGKKFILKGNNFIIGRDKTADISLNDPNMSRHHARITIAGGKYILEDMGSRNGTLVNDEKLSDVHPLENEDMIRMGTSVLKFLAPGKLETHYYHQMKHHETMDNLTEIYSRNFISETLESEVKRAKGVHSDLSIVLFDVDNFKKINDTNGHPGGDFVLKEIANLSKNSGIGTHDYVGRYGGEEFLIILTSAALDKAKEFAERLRISIEQHKFDYNGVTIPVTVSLGVASLGKQYPSTLELYRAADQALYASKNAGKNRVTCA